jgi:hypothetical protein
VPSAATCRARAVAAPGARQTAPGAVGSTRENALLPAGVGKGSGNWLISFLTSAFTTEKSPLSAIFSDAGTHVRNRQLRRVLGSGCVCKNKTISLTANQKQETPGVSRMGRRAKKTQAGGEKRRCAVGFCGGGGDAGHKKASETILLVARDEEAAAKKAMQQRKGFDGVISVSAAAKCDEEDDGPNKTVYFRSADLDAAKAERAKNPWKRFRA